MNLSFNPLIPATGNDPSDDQPLMQVNNASINSIIAIDHFGFNNSSNFGGWHQQATLINRTVIPTSIGALRGIIYTKQTANSAAGNESSLFYTPDATGNEYQLTRTVTGSSTLCGTFTQYQTQNIGMNKANVNGGWTFLPGIASSNGMIMQYGTIVAVASQLLTTLTTVTFSIPFPNTLYSIQLTIQGVGPNNTARVLTPSLTGFTYQMDTANFNSKIYFIALGN